MIEAILNDCVVFHRNTQKLIEGFGKKEWMDLGRWIEVAERGWPAWSTGETTVQEGNSLQLILPPAADVLPALRTELLTLFRQWGIFFSSPNAEFGLPGEEFEVPYEKLPIKIACGLTYWGASMEVRIRGVARLRGNNSQTMYSKPPIEFGSGNLTLTGGDSATDEPKQVYVFRITLNSSI